MIAFTLPFPVSLNQAYRAVIKGKYATVLISEKGRAYKKLVQHLLPKGNKYEGNIAVTLLAFEPDRRRRDADNYPKLLLDAMSTIMYNDDSQIVELTIIKKGLDKENPRVEVEINKCD